LYNKTENAEELRDLNEEQFCEMMTEFKFPGTQENFSAIFKSFDVNKNGMISLQEFMLIVRTLSEDMPEEKIKWAFKTYDANEDGTIDPHEMKRLVAAVYLSLADYIPSIKEDLKFGADGLGEEKAEELFHQHSDQAS
jgi:Ca2+-binding EF-hand superfamily protein